MHQSKSRYLFINLFIILSSEFLAKKEFRVQEDQHKREFKNKIKKIKQSILCMYYNIYDGNQIIQPCYAAHHSKIIMMLSSTPNRDHYQIIMEQQQQKRFDNGLSSLSSTLLSFEFDLEDTTISFFIPTSSLTNCTSVTYCFVTLHCDIFHITGSVLNKNGTTTTNN